MTKPEITRPVVQRHHVPALDGLRGFAILLVLYYHTCSEPALPPRWRLLSGMGWAGVDLFFVLSGFLITNILVSSQKSSTYYSAFYGRRFLRIAPVYYIALVLVFFVHPAIYHQMHPLGAVPAATWRQQICYWLNVSNLRSAFFPLEIPLASIYWSLGIEEQFYALWPMTIRHLNFFWISVVSTVGIFLSILLRCSPVTERIGAIYPAFPVKFTIFRLDGLLLGALLAIFLQAEPSIARRRAASISAFLLGTVVVLSASRGLTQPASRAMYQFGYTALALISSSLIMACVGETGRISRATARFFSIPLLRSFGTYSYSIYVFHILIIYAIGHAVARLISPLNLVGAVYCEALISVSVCYVVGALSWRFLEAPILSLKRYFPYRYSD